MKCCRFRKMAETERREAEAELTQIETTMRNKLMEMSRTK